MNTAEFLGTSWQNENIPLYLTDPLSDLQLNYFPNAYYIGYINSSVISSYHKNSSPEISGDIFSITPDEGGNIPVALMGKPTDNGLAQGQVFFLSDVLTQAANSRFVEKVEMSKYAMNPEVGIGLMGICQYGTSSIAENFVRIGSYKLVNWFNFKAGTEKLQYMEPNIGAAGYISYSDIVGNKFEVEGSTERGVYKIQLYLCYVRPTTSGGDGTGTTSLFPTLWYENYGYGIPQCWYWRSGYMLPTTDGTGSSWEYPAVCSIELTQFRVGYEQTSPYTRALNKIPFSVQSRVDRTTLTNIPIGMINVFGDVVYYKLSSEWVIVIPTFNIDEVEKIYYWGTKITELPSHYYGNDVWYPKMEGNRFVGDLIHVANQTEAEEQLEEVQQPGEEASEVNDFTEEDIPPDVGPQDIPVDDQPLDIDPGEKGDEGDVEQNTEMPLGISSFTTSYIMTAIEVKSFGSRLWTSVQNEPLAQKNFFTITNSEADYELINANIIDYLISLKWYPFSVPSYCNISQASAYYIGSGLYGYTGAAMIANDLVGYIPGGSVQIPWLTNTFVDLEPYTTISVYVPFCGTVDIPASKARGRLLSLYYYVDYITGGCTAYITTSTSSGTFPIASINGTMGFEVLVTGNNAQVMAAKAYQQNTQRSLAEIKGLGGAIVDAIGSLKAKDPVAGAKTMASALVDTAFSEIDRKLESGSLQGTSPLTLGTSASLSGLGYLKPFVAITSKVLFNNATGYQRVGYVSNKPLNISNIGDGVFFNCINPELKNVGATNSEIAQITSMLSSGVYK